MAQGPCLNPNCSSNGRPHPNCRCYARMANGGNVAECAGPHNPDCEYYLAEGGQLSPQPPMMQPVDQDPGETLGAAAIHGGLLGLMQNAGHAPLANFNQAHHKTLHESKLHPTLTGEEHANTAGSRLGKHLRGRDYDSAADSMYGSALTGQVSKANLKPILQRLHPEMLSQEPHPEAFRSAVNYLNTSMKGQDKLKQFTSDLLRSKNHKIHVDEKSREGLKEHIQKLALNPELALETGGHLGHYLPNHGVQLGALTGAAISYLDSIKPQRIPVGPLDDQPPISKSQESAYNRQVDIAQQPLLALEHVKNGTLIPQDIKTISTIYPSLYKKMSSDINEDLINAKSEGVQIPYHIKTSLSAFTGQSLDATLQQSNMQAAMAANMPQTPPEPPNGSKKPSKLSTAQQEKTNSLYETNTQEADSKKD